MRHVSFVVAFALVAWFGVGRAFASPFEPATVPDQVEAVGHLDVDALRKTQLFTAVGGQAALDSAMDEAPDQVRNAVRGVARAAHGVSFWKDGEHGAVYIDTRDARAIAQLIVKLPAKPVPSIDGFPTYAIDDDHHHGGKHALCAAFGGRLVARARSGFDTTGMPRASASRSLPMHSASSWPPSVNAIPRKWSWT